MGLWDSFLDRFRMPYDYQDLMKASAEVLGKGTYGTSYKASMDSGMAVVVTRLKSLAVSEAEFKTKMEEVGRLDHENLVPLRAFHFSSVERLLIHEYFPLGSLCGVLHGESGGRSALKWEIRAKIGLGTARGVQHIHSQGPTLCHGNIKSTNILLSKNYEARISDIGLSQVVSPSPSLLSAACFYRAPEAIGAHHRNTSQKADVYSFGVLLLELLTGKTPDVHASKEGVDLPRWVHTVLREEWSDEVFDAELLRYESVPEEEMVELLQLAVECTAEYPDSRPTMADAAARIERICGCTSSSVRPRKQDLKLKVAPQDLSLPTR